MPDEFRSDAPYQHRLPEPSAEGSVHRHSGRLFVTVRTADGLVWREAGHAVVDHQGQPVQQLEQVT